MGLFKLKSYKINTEVINIRNFKKSISFFIRFIIEKMKPKGKNIENDIILLNTAEEIDIYINKFEEDIPK